MTNKKSTILIVILLYVLSQKEGPMVDISTGDIRIEPEVHINVNSHNHQE